MCLTPYAFVAFLNLLPMDLIETDRDTVTINAEQGATVWIAKDDRWCTDAPARPLTAKYLKAD